MLVVIFSIGIFRQLQFAFLHACDPLRQPSGLHCLADFFADQLQQTLSERNVLVLAEAPSECAFTAWTSSIFRSSFNTRRMAKRLSSSIHKPLVSDPSA